MFMYFYNNKGTDNKISLKHYVHLWTLFIIFLIATSWLILTTINVINNEPIQRH